MDEGISSKAGDMSGNNNHGMSGGNSWVQATSAANWTARRNHTSLVYNNKMWVIGGYDAGGYKNDVWSSSDGITWTQQTSATSWTARNNHASLVYSNKMWVIGGWDSGYKNDVWYTDFPDWTQGKRGKALSFDGASQSVVLSSVPVNNLTNFTISGWFNTVATQVDDIYLEKNSASVSVWAGNINININEAGNGKLNFVWRNTANSIFSANGADALNDGKWHHFSAVREGSNMRLYTDGVLASSSSGLSGNIDATTAQISASQFGGRGFTGQIDEVRIYNRALSAGEGLGLYNMRR